jgi:hypothetical protein
MVSVKKKADQLLSLAQIQYLKDITAEIIQATNCMISFYTFFMRLHEYIRIALFTTLMHGRFV